MLESKACIPGSRHRQLSAFNFLLLINFSDVSGIMLQMSELSSQIHCFRVQKKKLWPQCARIRHTVTGNPWFATLLAVNNNAVKLPPEVLRACCSAAGSPALLECWLLSLRSTILSTHVLIAIATERLPSKQVDTAGIQPLRCLAGLRGLQQ